MVLRILVGWELGNGFGHVARLEPLVARLCDLGHEVIVHARYPRNAESLLKAGARSVDQAPFWVFRQPSPNRPGSAPGEHRVPAPATLADILVGGGLADPRIVAERMGEWCAILDRIRPDAVVSDYAPGLNAATRGRAPLLVLGSGFSVPPGDALYPLYPGRAWLPPGAGAAMHRIVAAFTAAAGEASFAPLRAFGDLFRGDITVPLVHPLLDPYRPWRSRPSAAPLGIARPIRSTAPRSGVFVYLPERHRALGLLLSALSRLGLKGAIFLRPSGARLSDETVARVRRTRLSLLERPADLSRVLPATDLAIHSGGAGVSHAALYAGTAQLVLPTVLEQRLTGEALRAAGRGACLSMQAGDASEASTLLEQHVVAGLTRAEMRPVPLPADDDALLDGLVTGVLTLAG